MARHQWMLTRAAGLALVAISGLTVASVACGQTTSTYIQNGNTTGPWHDTANWTGAHIPNAAGDGALLQLPLGSLTNGTYQLNIGANSTTVGSLEVVNNATAFTTAIVGGAGGVLNFKNTGSTAATFKEGLGASTAAASRTRINVPVVLESDLIVTQDHNLALNTATEFVGKVSGSSARTFTKEGFGNLQMAYDGTFDSGEGYFGKYVINNGAIRLIGASSITNSSGITVNQNGQLQIGNAVATTTPLSLGLNGESDAVLTLNGTGKIMPSNNNNDGALRFQPTGGSILTQTFASPVVLQTNSRISVNPIDGTGVLTRTVSGNGALLKTGPGLLRLTGANTYGGGTTVTSGHLAVNNSAGSSGVGTGDVSVSGSGTLGGTGFLGTAGDNSNVSVTTGGTLSPGGLEATTTVIVPVTGLITSPGVLNIFGGLTLDSASFLNMDLNGATVGTQYDQVVVSGDVALGGSTLNFALGAFVPAGTETFTLISKTGAGAIGGEFGNYAQGAMVDLAGKTFYMNYHGGVGNNDVVLSPTPPVIEDANFDNDTDVDGADFLTWQAGFGGPGDDMHGDADGNGQVNGLDFDIWKGQFGTTGLATIAAVGVPEPHALALALAGLSVAPWIRRRRASCN